MVHKCPISHNAVLAYIYMLSFQNLNEGKYHSIVLHHAAHNWGKNVQMSHKSRWNSPDALRYTRGRPWHYSVIPRTPDFQTEYQIRRNSNPAGIPVFAAIWGPDFRPSNIILTNMFKQIKQIRITFMTMFKVDPSPPNELR